MLRTIVSATLATRIAMTGVAGFLAADAAAQAPKPYVEGEVPPTAFLEAARNKVMFPETRNAYFGDVGEPKTISMYGLKNATYWEADLDVDCDGKPSENCNKARDPWFQPQLSASSTIQSEFTPHIVIPISSPSNSKQRDILYGQVGVVIHKESLVYGLLLDECGVKELIGEASYAAVKLLGVNPDPHHGGTDDPTHFFFFPGPTGRLANPADWTNHQKVIEIGNARAKQLMADYNIAWQSTALFHSHGGGRPVRAGGAPAFAAPGHRILSLDGRLLAGAHPPVPGAYVLRAR